MNRSEAYSETIIRHIKKQAGLSSKELFEHVKDEISYATLKRALKDLLQKELITTIGRGKATRYELSRAYDVMRLIDVEEYYKKDIDARKVKKQFDHGLIREVLNKTTILLPGELERLNAQQKLFAQKIKKIKKGEYKKDMERLAIDLSWKSSQIEGNTYSLLETERLLKDKETAGGKTKDEAVMLLNHKDAIDFIASDPTYVKPLKLSVIEDIHSILIKELGVDRNIRKRMVGITGTNYKPLDNEFQIREAMEELCGLINLKENAFEKAILVLALISYIQPFNDGNKRTARIISNAMLINAGYCPLSFRTVDALDYKKAILIFYECNNLSAIKRIFIEQFEFAVETYF